MREDNWRFQEYNDENDSYSDLLIYSTEHYPHLIPIRLVLATHDTLLVKFIQIYHDNDPIGRLKTIQLIN